LDGGEDWSVLAAEYSTDEGNANNGGDLGWFNANAMVEAFSDAAFSLEEPGQISEPVQTDFGWHIIQLVGKREVPMTETTLQQEKAAVFADWLLEIREAREDIEIFDDWAKYVPTTPALNATLMNALGIYE
jgi:parvulin-like peptidyl-prolyl isomerase